MYLDITVFEKTSRGHILCSKALSKESIVWKYHPDLAVKFTLGDCIRAVDVKKRDKRIHETGPREIYYGITGTFVYHLTKTDDPVAEILEFAKQEFAG